LRKIGENIIRFIKHLFLFFIFLLLIFNCSSNDEKITTPTKEEKCSPHDKEGPLASGCPNTTYPDWKTSPYILPYPVGQAFKIDLSNCSGSYHSEGRPDEFAIDFNMEIETLITAARSGKVVHVEESGLDRGRPNNLVIIDHGDNTYAEYMHLTHNGAFVKVGDFIERGDSIGLSGSTGLAGYPHLHFVVTEKSWQWPYKSIPITFCNTLSNERSLASDTVYEAFSY
jgi:hypothetical protein